ncbi:MAG TPA: TIGR03364 family FAD-dependent oxidoreductase [Vicinamibacterales bacterium]
MRTEAVDVAIVGAGIVGLAHAYVAARAGRSVAVFERNPEAIGASVRNFGMIWPIGLPPGKVRAMALRSREVWLDVLREAKLPFSPTGSLHVAYRNDEAAVGREFAEMAPALGYECAWLARDEALERSRAIRAEGLVGALWSGTELTVDPRRIVGALPAFLAEQYGVQFFFNTAVQSVESSFVAAGGRRWNAGAVVVAGGDDFQTLFPEQFRESGVTRCKLQMMRTVRQPDGWTLGPSLAFGLTFTHYATFRWCASLGALKERIRRETPELERWGIHVLVSQTSAGELTIGDSHETGLAVSVFDKPHVNRLILEYARQHLDVPTLEIGEQWHGVYAKHPDHAFLDFEPLDGVRAITVTNGLGMTLSFGIAEHTFSRIVPAA